MNEYKLIKANSEEDLSKSVENFLNQGYRCQGGVSHDNEYYIQAMLRKKPVKA